MQDAGPGEISGRPRQVFFPGKIAPPWLLWVAANGVVVVAVPTLALALRGTAGRQALAAVVYPSTLALLALAQGLALARWLARPRRWMLATLAGGACAWFLGALGLGALDPLGVDETLLAAAAHGAGGAIVGAAQAAAARGRLDSAAVRWTAASGVSAAVFAFVFLPFWADAAIPGYAGTGFAGSRELTTLLRTVGACGIVTAPLVAPLVETGPAQPDGGTA